MFSVSRVSLDNFCDNWRKGNSSVQEIELHGAMTIVKMDSDGNSVYCLSVATIGLRS